MVLTEQKEQKIYPAATLEGNINATGQPNAINIEKDYYKIDVANVVSKSLATGIPSYTNESNGITVNNPYSVPTATSDKVYRLQAIGGVPVTGLSMTLKVMSGDKIDIFGKSYYFDNSTTATNSPLTAESIITGLFASGASMLGSKSITAAEMSSDAQIAGAIGSFLTNSNRGTDNGSTRPKAYINWILFDENLQMVDGGFSRVATTGSLKDHFSEVQAIELKNNGYLYVYCSNESSKQVFFDNLQVVHTKGPLVEETHYYPFGLTMVGISPQTLGGIKNNYKFNKGSELCNEEFTDGSGLEIYDTKFRKLDPQIARWLQIDPKPENGLSPYGIMKNNPILYNDPLGDSIPIKGTFVITLGASASADFQIKGTPVSVGGTINTGEIDFIGVRDNDLKAIGKNFTTGKREIRKEIGGSIAGFGASIGSVTSKDSKTKIQNTEITKEYKTPISNTLISINKETGNVHTSNSIGFHFKLAGFIGIEAGLTIPVGLNYLQSKPEDPGIKRVDNVNLAKPFIDKVADNSSN